MRRLLVMALALGLSACATTAPPMADSAPPALVPLPAPSDGAIFQAGREPGLFRDNKAQTVGDVLTVVLVERTNAKKSASTSSKKDNSLDVGVPSLFGQEISKAGASLDASRSFAGGGDSSQSNQLDGNLTVTVVERLANGNLRIAGEKRLRLNQGDETIRVSGIVRPVDINPDNTLLSSRIAEARITYSGSGSLADANAQGWLTRIFGSPWWPF